MRLSNQASGSGDPTEVPEDKGNAIYLTFLLYGIGVLLPFNVILSCIDFYEDKVSVHSQSSYLILLAEYNSLHV